VQYVDSRPAPSNHAHPSTGVPSPSQHAWTGSPEQHELYADDQHHTNTESLHNSQLLNNSGFSEDLLNSSVNSVTPTKPTAYYDYYYYGSNNSDVALGGASSSSYDVFDRFVVKVGIVIRDVEILVEANPTMVSPGVLKKIEEVKKDANGLCRMIRTLDAKNESKLLEAEARADGMAVEVSKLKEDVESLLNANSEMYEKLVEHGHQEGLKLKDSPRKGLKGINESVLIDVEDKLQQKTEEIVKLRHDYEALQKEKQTLINRCSNLQNDLDDVLDSYQEVVEQKVNMQYEMLDSQKEMKRRVDVKDKITKLKQREVSIIFDSDSTQQRAPRS
jgi:hypothetical protein